MRRIVGVLLAMMLVTVPVWATQIIVLSGGCGTGTPTTGQDIVYVDTAGNACSSATLSGGTVTAATTATASATPTVVAPGTGKALNESLNSGLFTELSVGGTLVDATHGLPVGTGTAGTAATPVVTVQGIASMTPLAVTQSGQVIDPCQANTVLFAPISQTGNAKYISAVSAKKNYICSIMLITADAESVSLVGGTGSTCGTNTEAVIGATTAANGPALAANGGWTMGNGKGSIAAGATTNEDVCLFESGSGRIAGVLTYVQQ